MDTKLITLENLGTFLNNLVLDASVSGQSTWSSEKISEELADISTALSDLDRRIKNLEPQQ